FGSGPAAGRSRLVGPFHCYQAACPLLPADRLVLSRQDEGGDMMYRRIVTSLIAVLVVFAMAVPVAAARLSQQALVNQRPRETGAWAMPTAKAGEPPGTRQRALIRARPRQVRGWAGAPTKREGT